MQKEFGLVGLGKMGAGLARNVMRKGWRVVGWNRTTDVARAMEQEGLVVAETFADLVAKLEKPRVVWLMLPAGDATKEALFGENGLASLLEPEDIVVEGGNSYWEDDAANHAKLKEKGIRYIDAGVSGGPGGARNGACVMIGGERDLYEHLEPLFKDMAAPEACQFFPGVGAGHLVKMVHNGIEYGMMQAIAEGFEVMKKSPFGLNLSDVTRIYNHRSVVESRLVGWLADAYKTYGDDLAEVSPTVAHTGEGEWTVKTAQKFGVPVPIIEGSYQFRVRSAENPSYAGRVLSALRNMFGGHAIK